MLSIGTVHIPFKTFVDILTISVVRTHAISEIAATIISAQSVHAKNLAFVGFPCTLVNVHANVIHIFISAKAGALITSWRVCTCMRTAAFVCSCVALVDIVTQDSIFAKRVSIQTCTVETTHRVDASMFASGTVQTTFVRIHAQVLHQCIYAQAYDPMRF